MLQSKWCSPQPPQLFERKGPRQGMLDRLGHRLVAADNHFIAGIIANSDAQWLAGVPTDFDVQWTPLRQLIRLPGPLQAATQGGVVRLPKRGSDRNGAQIDGSAAECEFEREGLNLRRRDRRAGAGRSPCCSRLAQFRIPLSDFRNAKNSAALFVLLGMSFVEDDPVTGSDGEMVDRAIEGQFVRHATMTPRAVTSTTVPIRTPRLLGNRPCTSCWWLTPSRNPCVNPREKLWARSSSCCCDRAKGRRVSGRVDRGAVRLRRRGDVLRALEPALDLEAAHAEVGQLADQVVRRQVLRAEQVRASPRSRSRRRRSARTAAGRPGTLPAVGAAAADRLAGQALAAVRHAQRPVDEDLDRHVASRR